MTIQLAQQEHVRTLKSFMVGLWCLRTAFGGKLRCKFLSCLLSYILRFFKNSRGDEFRMHARYIIDVHDQTHHVSKRCCGQENELSFCSCEFKNNLFDVDVAVSAFAAEGRHALFTSLEYTNGRIDFSDDASRLHRHDSVYIIKWIFSIDRMSRWQQRPS